MASVMLVLAVNAAAATATGDAQKLLFGVISPACYDSLLVQRNFFDTVCLKLVISKLLSFVIIAGSFILKVPQIMKILPEGKVTGLSASMFVIETIGYSISIVYNYRRAIVLTTYAELWIIWFQDLFIVYLIYRYTNALTVSFFLSSIAYLCAVSAGLLGYIPMDILTFLFSINIGIFAASRVPQILQNFKGKSTGKLALVSIALAFVGGLARIFTTLQEVPDMLVLAGNASGAALNGVLLFQILWYWQNTQAQERAESKKKAK